MKLRRIMQRPDQKKPRSSRKLKRSRRDKGRVVLTERDIAVLHWIGEQYVVRFDQVQELLQRHTPLEARHVPQMSVGATRQVVRRWQRGGLAVSEKVLYHEPPWIWLTEKGIGEVLAEPFRMWRPKPGMLTHYFYVNAVRLYIEHKHPETYHWVSERILARKQGIERSHRVDGEVETPQGVVGVEVELTVKSGRELNTIIRQLVRQYASIWYFTLPATHTAVTQTIALLTPADRERCGVYPLAEVL